MNFQAQLRRARFGGPQRRMLFAGDIFGLTDKAPDARPAIIGKVDARGVVVFGRLTTSYSPVVGLLDGRDVDRTAPADLRAIAWRVIGAATEEDGWRVIAAPNSEAWPGQTPILTFLQNRETSLEDGCLPLADVYIIQAAR